MFFPYLLCIFYEIIDLINYHTKKSSLQVFKKLDIFYITTKAELGPLQNVASP